MDLSSTISVHAICKKNITDKAGSFDYSHLQQLDADVRVGGNSISHSLGLYAQIR
jgi:hypothetical protein